jgi:hypothetical protein
MSGLFADTSFFFAFLNLRDEHHQSAVDFMARYHGTIVTTNWVLVELGNYLAASRYRRVFVEFVHRLCRDSRFAIISAHDVLFERGLRLYQRREDKRWSMTDCISFVVMHEQSLTNALTADHHFQQAGFEVLLK